MSAELFPFRELQMRTTQPWGHTGQCAKAVASDIPWRTLTWSGAEIRTDSPRFALVLYALTWGGVEI